MGLDNLYVLLQTLVLYFVGSTQLTTMQSPLCFMGALLLMVCVSTGIFFYMFRGQNGGNIYFVVLVGMIFGITFGGLSNFMQVLIDPSEFAILEGRLFASFNRINEPRRSSGWFATSGSSMCLRWAAPRPLRWA